MPGLKASSSITAGHYAEALLCFDEVLARHGRDLEILIKRGGCYLQLDKPEKALADFDRVNQHRSGPRAFWAERDLRPQLDALSDRLAGNSGRSTSPKAGATAASPCSCSTGTKRRSRASRPRSALEPAAEPQESMRACAAAYQGLGQSYHRLGQDETALQAYDQAISIYPADANGFAGPRRRARVAADARPRADPTTPRRSGSNPDALASLLRPRHRVFRAGPRRAGAGRPGQGHRA